MGEEADAVADDSQWADAVVERPQVLGVEAMSADGLTIRLTARTAPQKQDAFARALRARIAAGLRREGIALAKPPVTTAPAAPSATEPSAQDSE